MQCFSLSFPQQITSIFSSMNQQKFHPSLSISWVRGKGKGHNFNFFASCATTVPNVRADKLNFQSKDTFSGGLKQELNINIPNHVAIIMDGSRRWALEKGLSVEDGYRTSTSLMKNMAGLCSQWGVKVLSWFTISTENLVRRPQKELDLAMICLKEQLESDLEDYMREGIKVSIIGDASKLPTFLQETITLVEEATKANTRLHVLVATNYGGRNDIMNAVKAVASKVSNGEMQVEDINEESFEGELLTKCCSEFPNPDLLIRTSGEQRVSNFMLWQLAYTELFFVDKFFPDFGEGDLIDALNAFRRRHRRFGGYKR